MQHPAPAASARTTALPQPHFPADIAEYLGTITAKAWRYVEIRAWYTEHHPERSSAADLVAWLAAHPHNELAAVVALIVMTPIGINRRQTELVVEVLQQRAYDFAMESITISGMLIEGDFDTFETRDKLRALREGFTQQSKDLLAVVGILSAGIERESAGHAPMANAKVST